MAETMNQPRSSQFRYVVAVAIRWEMLGVLGVVEKGRVGPVAAVLCSNQGSNGFHTEALTAGIEGRGGRAWIRGARVGT